MPVNVGDILLMTVRGTCFGQRIILTHTYQVSIPPDPTTTPAAALGILVTALNPAGPADWITSYLACLPPQYIAESFRLQWLLAVRSAYVSQSLSPLVGTNVGVCTTANDSAALTFRTVYSGRDQVSTKHIGPIPDNAKAIGLLAATYTASVNTLGIAMRATIAPTGNPMRLNPIIFHRASGTGTTINNQIIGIQSRVQRRRTVGLGE